MIIFTFSLVALLSIYPVKNEKIVYLDSEDFHPSPDLNSEKLSLELELKFYRQREKDINDTINQILEDMATMRDYILHLEDTITAVASEATRNTKHIQDNADDIIIVAETVSSVNDSLKNEVSFVNTSLS